MKKFSINTAGLLGALLLITTSAQATVLDLTTAGASGLINSAIYQQAAPQPTGTGYIDSFLRIDDGSNNGRQVEGYNTTVNNVFDNLSDDTHNHEISLSDVPIVNIGGIDYRQFLLDINEPNGHGKNDPTASLLSLDEVQVFLSNTPNQQTESFVNNILALTDASLVYRMDAGVNSWVGLDAGLNNGSGSGDMFLYIPTALFTGPRQYVYLYSHFGDGAGYENSFQNTGGFEEWAVLPGVTSTGDGGGVVPEPTSMLLLGSGLAGFALRRRKA